MWTDELKAPILNLSDECRSSGISEESENELSPETNLSHLTNLVRKQYYTYVEKLLRTNYESYCSQNMVLVETDPKKCIEYFAKGYELKAVKACMVVQLYRKAMLKIITKIRRATAQGVLIINLDDINNVEGEILDKSQHKVDFGVQTEELIKNEETNEHKICTEVEGIRDMKYECLTLQDKINFFQQRLDEREQTIAKKVYNTSKKRKHPDSYMVPACSPNQKSPKVFSVIEAQNNETKQQEDDEIARELDMLFGEENDELDDIFGKNSTDPQIDLILKEIEQSQPQVSAIKHIQCKTKHSVQNENYLYESLWPCEFHMRKERLTEVLSRIVDRGIRYHEKLQNKFVELFGEDSDDEFGPYSPSLDINEILLSSCKKRIAPWIVKHLMKPMKEGLIANRFLFKKLAKRLAHCIILDNQYPDEEYIRSAVEDYFCFRRKINCSEDIEFG